MTTMNWTASWITTEYPTCERCYYNGPGFRIFDAPGFWVIIKPLTYAKCPYCEYVTAFRDEEDDND